MLRWRNASCKSKCVLLEFVRIFDGIIVREFGACKKLIFSGRSIIGGRKDGRTIMGEND